MISKPVAELLEDLQVTRSQSRPQISNDKPYSEAWFKALKCAPKFSERFGTARMPKVLDTPEAARINRPEDRLRTSSNRAARSCCLTTHELTTLATFRGGHRQRPSPRPSPPAV